MSELTYKKIVDVETVEALNDGATVFVNDGGAMKQIDMKAAVKLPEKILKTVVNADIEDDGTVLSVPTYYFQIVDPSYSGLPLNNYGLFTAAELNSCMTANRFDTHFVRIILTSGNTFTRFCIGVEIVSAAVKKYYFGEDLAPIIVDGDNNTFTIDPDWVKPEENAGGIPRLFVINEPIDEEPFAKMTPSMTYEELKALLEADNPPILVMKEIYGEEGVQDVALSVQNCSYFIGDGVIKMRAGCEMRYTSDGTFEPVPV